MIGASTTSCDVCHDCSKMGIDVTMIQRGPTRIYPSDHITQVQLMFWNDKGGADLGDVITSEDPVVLQAALSAQILKELKDRHKYVAKASRQARLCGHKISANAAVSDEG